MSRVSRAPSLLVMAGGTGGHIFPGLAVAAAMRERGWTVRWLGGQGMERELVPGAGIEMASLQFSGLRGKGLRHAWFGAWAFLRSLFAARRILKQWQPDVVLGMGGYVTVPAGLVAGLSGRTLALINADASPLLSNKLLLPWARKVMFGFAGDCGALGRKAVVTGNPVRAEICALPAPDVRYAGRSGALRVLVVGGSLGARALNEVLPAALARLPLAQRPLLTHQSGKAHLETLRAAYATHGVEAELLDFIDDMPQRLASADLVICRAGAITAAELTAAGVASLLVPLVVSTTSHQRDNAKLLAAAGAALHLPQAELSAERVAEILLTLERGRCLQMAKAAYAMGRRDASARIAQILQTLQAEAAA